MQVSSETSTLKRMSMSMTEESYILEKILCIIERGDYDENAYSDIIKLLEEEQWLE